MLFKLFATNWFSIWRLWYIGSSSMQRVKLWITQDAWINRNSSFFTFLHPSTYFLRQVVNVLSIFSDLKGWEDEIGSEERWKDIEVKSACTSVNTRIDKSIITNIRFFIDLKLNIEIWLNWNPYTSLYTIECLEAFFFFFNKRINL